jgi:phenylpropionate dioxygenase-like ring-hydroxylating dioxygenase large terminal subunit
MNANVMEQRPKQVTPWENGAYFQSWYPLCLSSQLEAGKVIGRDFLNTRVVLYRSKDDKAVVQSAYCPHFGSDLSLGAIDNGELRCAYHQWRFNAEGRCSHIPSGDPIPRNARIHNYPAEERYGMVWAFNGNEALFPVPSFPGVAEEQLLLKVIERSNQPVEAWIPPSNSVDFQHLLTIHHFPKTAVPESIEVTPFSLGYKSDFLRAGGEGTVWGCNTFVQYNMFPLPFETFTMFTSTAVRPNVCRPFFVAAVRKPNKKEEMEGAQQQLEAVTSFAENLYVEDELILNTIRIRQPGEAMLVRSDAGLAKFFRYISDLPQARPFDA